MDEKLIEELKKLARTECIPEDACIDDYAGGNVDDAFYHGQTEGQATLARYILNRMEISWS